MEPFDAYEFARHLGARWRITGLACGVAVVIAFAASLLLPKKYTATARILIEPPAGSDPRAATAVSPIYLESLRTYEHFASSDSLFLSALDHFRLRDGQRARSVESWKREVLKVEIPRSTKILEISATLRTPASAHALALYLAEETVKLSRKVSREGDQDLVADLERQHAETKARLEAAEAERARLALREPLARLQAEISSAEEARTGVLEELLPAEITLAEESENEKLPSQGEREAARSRLSWARLRAAMLRQRRDQLDAEIGRKQQSLAEWKTRDDDASAHLLAARAAFQAAENRLREVRGAVGYRGERLSIVDTGIIPERPSSPNTPLNVLAALLFGLVASLLYVTLEFGWRREGRVLDRTL